MLGYRIEADGASVLSLSDHEPYWERLWRSDAEPGRLESILHDGDRRHAAFMENADVVVHDAQYTPEQYASKKNWGHSTFSYATQIAAAANVRRLILTHHDPAHDDDFVDRIEERAREQAEKIIASLGDAESRALAQPATTEPGRRERGHFLHDGSRIDIGRAEQLERPRGAAPFR